nr:hypothetical protein [uncultured Megasphaera sp.]
MSDAASDFIFDAAFFSFFNETRSSLGLMAFPHLEQNLAPSTSFAPQNLQNIRIGSSLIFHQYTRYAVLSPLILYILCLFCQIYL